MMWETSNQRYHGVAAEDRDGWREICLAVSWSQWPKTEKKIIKLFTGSFLFVIKLYCFYIHITVVTGQWHGTQRSPQYKVQAPRRPVGTLSSATTAYNDTTHPPMPQRLGGKTSHVGRVAAAGDRGSATRKVNASTRVLRSAVSEERRTTAYSRS